MLVTPAVILCIAFLLLLGFVASRRANRRKTSHCHRGSIVQHHLMNATQEMKFDRYIFKTYTAFL